MRLSPHELNTLRQVLHEADPGGRAWLFGSRADDTRRGGDIDAFLEASTTVTLKTRLALEATLAARCGCKVDLVVKNPDAAEEPIFEIARRGIVL